MDNSGRLASQRNESSDHTTPSPPCYVRHIRLCHRARIHNLVPWGNGGEQPDGQHVQRLQIHDRRGEDAIKISVLGIGNLLLGDEGVGVHAVKALRDGYVFTEDVRFIDGGTMGLDLLPYIEGTDRLLIIDAVDFDAQPGTVRVIEGKALPVFLDTKFSVHQIGLPDLLFAAALKGITPPELCLVGIQPDKLEIGLQLSVKVRPNFQVLIDTALEKLSGWGVEIMGAVISSALTDRTPEKAYMNIHKE